MNKIFTAILLLVTLISCHTQTEWQMVKYDGEINHTVTECITDHQGEHALTKIRSYIDNDTIFIVFPAELPAYWGNLTIKIHNNNFNARFDGVPFSNETFKFETTHQELVLQKTQYVLNDTIRGYCNFTFKQINQETQQYVPFYFKGSFAAIVRDKNFDALNHDNFMTFDMPTALYELGEPVDNYLFNTYRLPEFRVELLNYLPASEDVTVNELTWNISETREISDEGKEQLTIWYIEKNKNWFPVHYKKWNADMQF